MTKAERLVRLQDITRQMTKEADQSEGALQQLKGQMKKVYGCKNIEEIEQTLTTLETETEMLEERYETKLGKCEKEVNDALESYE